MGKKGGTNFASLVGWTGGFLIFSAFLIWALDDGVYSWLQNPLPNTGGLESAGRSGLFMNFSMTQDRQHDGGISGVKSESNTGEGYFAKNVTGTVSHQDVNGSNPGIGNMSAIHVPVRGRSTNKSMAEPSSSSAGMQRQYNNKSMVEPSSPSAGMQRQYNNKSMAEPSSPSAGMQRQYNNKSMAETWSPSAGMQRQFNNKSMAEPSSPSAGMQRQYNNKSMAETWSPSAGMQRQFNNKSMAEPLSPSAGMQRQCNLFKGKWVYDKSYVLYLPGSCPYASIDFNCRKNGRVDSDYERWRWQPQDCDLPRFNASLMLETLRDKRLLFVGDSINRNQWESMLCLLRAAVPQHEITHKFEDSGKFIQYFFKAYNCSVELSWAPFLVRQHPVRATNGSVVKETLQLDSIDEQAKRWKNADVLVFNTGHWWTHEEPYNGVDYFEERGRVIPHMEELVAFEKALRTWVRWVDTNIDPKHAQVFFRGYSPVHFHGQAWGKKVGGGCFRETEPVNAKIEKKIERIYGERKRVQVVEKVVRETKNVRVKLLNVTKLSMYRKDAHASVYTSKLKYMTNENDYSIVDCSHWCLPGLPDVWNNILYALIT